MAFPSLFPRKSSPWQVFIILALGVFCVSTAAIFIRLALAASGRPGVGFSLVLSALRLVLASVMLLPSWTQLRRSPLQKGAIAYSGFAGVLLAVHFATWITSLSYTSIAASTTLVTTNPIWVALLSWLWFRETLSLQMIVGIAITLAGGLLIGLEGSSTMVGQYPMLGNMLALVGSWSISLHFLLGREAQRRGLAIGNHVAIAYSAAAVVLLPLPLFFNAPYWGYPPQVYLWIALMALFPQMIGHTSFNWAVHQISPTLVTLAILLEPVGSSFLGYLVFGEVPSLQVGVGAAVILTGVAIAALGNTNRPAADASSTE